MNTALTVAAGLLTALAAAAPASAQTSTTTVTTVNSVPAVRGGMRSAARRLADVGAINVDRISIVHVTHYRGRVDAATQRIVGDALAHVRVERGSASTYSNAPSPGNLSDYLHRLGILPSTIVGLDARADSATVYTTTAP